MNITGLIFSSITDNEDYHKIFSGMLEELVHAVKEVIIKNTKKETE